MARLFMQLIVEKLCKSKKSGDDYVQKIKNKIIYYNK